MYGLSGVFPLGAFGDVIHEVNLASGGGGFFPAWWKLSKFVASTHIVRVLSKVVGLVEGMVLMLLSYSQSLTESCWTRVCSGVVGLSYAGGPWGGDGPRGEGALP